MIDEILSDKKIAQLANTPEARMSLVGEEVVSAIPYDSGDRVIYVLKTGHSFEIDFVTLGFVVRNPKETQKTLSEMDEHLKPIMDTSEAIKDSLELIGKVIGDKQGSKQNKKGGVDETSGNVVQG